MCSWILRTALLLSPVAAAATAGAQSVTATVQGTIADDQGAVLPRVTVTIANVETGLTRAGVTDDHGRYRAAALPPGPYQLRAELSGFRTETQSGFMLTTGQDATVDLTMKLASIEQSIVVTAAMPRIDTTHHAIGSTVTRTQLDTLPLASRDFASLALLSPGIFASPDLARPGSSAFGDSFTSGGQTSRNNSVLVDGLSNDEIVQGTTRGGFSLETVREFVVLANQFSAEHGLASGAIVSVVTRSGTNSLQSRAFLFHRNDRLDAQDPLSAAQGSGRAPFNLQRFGGFAGGPLIRDRLHYFGSYEGLRQSRTSVVTSPLVPIAEREIPNDSRQHLLFGRSDYRFSDASSWWIRYRLNDGKELAGGIGGVNARERGFNTLGRAQDLAVDHMAVMSGRALQEFRFQFARHVVDSQTFAPLSAPSISRPSGNFGKPADRPFGRTSNHYQFVEHFSYSRGGHDVKLGADVTVVRVPAYRYFNLAGSFTFATDLPFDANDPATHPTRFTQNFGSPFTQRDDEIYAVFFQDHWRLRRNLTVNVGARYDRETAYKRALGVDDDRNNIVPRLGLVWDPSRDGRTAVRGGYGWYSDQALLNITGNIQSARQFTSVTINNPGYPDPYSRGSVAPLAPSTEIAASAIQTPQTRQISIGIQRELRPGLSISADVLNTRGYHLYNAPDINSPDADPINRIRPNPNFLSITQHETTGNSWYSGLLVGLDKRSGRGPAFGISYTLARQVRDVEDFLFRGQNQLNRDAEKAIADNNRTHQLVANTTWVLAAGWQIGAILQAWTGLPWTITTGIDNNGDRISTNDRPDLVVPGGNPLDRSTYFAGYSGRVGTLGRNTATGPSYLQLDARLSKFVTIRRARIELFLEGFNVTNRTNLGKPVGNLRSAQFGESTGLAGPPRQLEIGFRLDF